jgi:hypothetical protein
MLIDFRNLDRKILMISANIRAPPMKEVFSHDLETADSVQDLMDSALW